MSGQDPVWWLRDRQKSLEGEDGEVPREIVKDFRRNSALLFSIGPFGWVTGVWFLSLCIRVSDKLGEGNYAEIW